MGWLAISIGISMFVTLCVHWQNREYNHRQRPIANWINVDKYLISAFVSLVLSLVFVGIIGSLYSKAVSGRDITAEGCEESVNRWEIVSAIRDKQHQSSFILGTGGGSTVDTYYVYRQEPQGLMLANYNAHRTYVVEQDGQPAYERIDHICPNPVYDFLWWSSGNTHRNVNRIGTLYVPKDTILREFKL